MDSLPIGPSFTIVSKERPGRLGSLLKFIHPAKKDTPHCWHFLHFFLNCYDSAAVGALPHWRRSSVLAALGNKAPKRLRPNTLTREWEMASRSVLGRNYTRHGEVLASSSGIKCTMTLCFRAWCKFLNNLMKSKYFEFHKYSNTYNFQIFESTFFSIWNWCFQHFQPTKNKLQFRRNAKWWTHQSDEISLMLRASVLSTVLCQR